MNRDKQATWIGAIGALVFVGMYIWSLINPGIDTAALQQQGMQLTQDDNIGNLAYLIFALYSFIMGKITNKPEEKK